MDTMVPEIHLWFGDDSFRDLGIDGFVTQVTVSRRIDKLDGTREEPEGKNLRSTATVILSNVDGQLWSFPRLYERVEVYMGYRGGGLYFRGGFLITSPTFDLPSSGGMKITLGLEDAGHSMTVTGAGRNFFDMTLEQAVRRMAEIHGLRYRIHPELAGIKIHSQIGQKRGGSDWRFLEQVIHKSVGAHHMYVDDNPAGEGAPVLVVDKLDSGVELRRNDKIVSLGYRVPADFWLNSLVVRVKGDSSKDITGATVDKKGDTRLLLGRPGSTPGTPLNSVVLASRPRILTTLGSKAMTAAATGRTASGSNIGASTTDIVTLPSTVESIEEYSRSVSLWNDNKITLTGRLHPAVPFLYAGHIVELRGAGPFSGNVQISQITDTYGASGYLQTLTFRSASGIVDSNSAQKVHKVAALTSTRGVTRLLVVDHTAEIGAVQEAGGGSSSEVTR